MKELGKKLTTCLTLLLVFATMSACRTGPATPASESKGLVPGQASTGDPPLIPHDVDASDGGQECRGCHQVGEGALGLPQWHETLTDCRQCHVQAVEGDATFEPQY